jgi:hypothetical protein
MQEDVLSFWKGLARLSSLGAATRQACDLEGAGAGARQLSKFKVILSYLTRKSWSIPAFSLWWFYNAY